MPTATTSKSSAGTSATKSPSEQALAFGDTLVEATLASVKKNQELAGKAFWTVGESVLSGLGTTSVSEWADTVRESVAAGFAVAKDALELQRELADNVLRAAGAAASAVKSTISDS